MTDPRTLAAAERYDSLKLITRVRSVMADGQARTLLQISKRLAGVPPQSVSACLSRMRAAGYSIEKSSLRYRVYAYRLVSTTPGVGSTRAARGYVSVYENLLWQAIALLKDSTDPDHVAWRGAASMTIRARKMRVVAARS